MNDFLKSVAVPALVAFVAGPVGTYVLSDWQDQKLKARVVKQEQALKFVASSDEISLNFTKFINAKSKDENIAPIVEEARASVSKQIGDVGRLKVVFADRDSKQYFSNFESSLTKYAESIKTWNDPKNLRNWIESFDGLIEDRRVLSTYLARASSIS